jgi:hypothetical protein
MPMRKLGVALAILCGVTLASCGGVAKTYDFKPRPFAAKSQPTLDQITHAIMRAGPRQNWRMTLVRPGLIEARREWGGGKHNIVVEVVYDTTQYRIDYKSSKNLRYSGGTVHRAYNRETIRLYDEIYRQTSQL